MKQFFAFVTKEFYHIFRDRRTLVILLGMPIVQILIFGFALSNEVKNANIVVLDQSRDEVTRKVIHQINASRYFTVSEHVSSYEQIESAFRGGKAKLAIVFPSGFAADLGHMKKSQVQIVADASDPNTATTLTAYCSSIIRDFEQDLRNNEKLPYSISTTSRMLYNPHLNSSYNFVPGVMAMVLMLVCTMMTAITVVREKEMGTMEIMLASPLQPIKIVIAKAVPYLLLSLLNIISILVLSVFVLNVPINGSLVLLIAESLLFILTCLSLGLLISTVTASQQTAMFISLVGLFLPTVMLSGFMFPIENMPVPLQIIAQAVPAKWFYSIVQSIMIKGTGLMSVIKETGILLGMTTVLLLLSVKNFKLRLA
jgi:ABC-2 type transport system permease protein